MFADNKNDSDHNSIDNNACEAVPEILGKNCLKALNVLDIHFMYVMTYSQC
jgi:hypothetical protein